MNRELMLAGIVVSMALVTYLTRAGGLLLMRGGASPLAEKFIRHAASAVLVALIVSAAFDAGRAGLVCVVSAALAMFVSRNVFAAMIVGVASAALTRQFI